MTDPPAVGDLRTWPDVLSALVAGRELAPETAAWAMEQVLAGAAGPAQIGGLAVGLATRGETAAELTAFADAMLAAATRIRVPGPTLDVVGTGGDRSGTVNVSTMAAVVAAAAGARVVKHGSRAASSKAGSADVLEALGLVLALPPERVVAVAEQVGITFCLATAFHPAMRHAAGPRRELGIRTVFNILGPLANPAAPTASMIGCADHRLAPLMAQVMAGRPGYAVVVRGDDGLDELTTTGTSSMWVVAGGEVRHVTLDPAAALGIPRAGLADLRGGDADANAGVFTRLLDGERGPVRDIVELNAAAALAVGGGGLDPDQDPGLTGALSAGLDRARAALDTGAARALLDRWVAATAEPVPAT